MTAGVFDFDALNKRVKELGIDPVYAQHEERLARPQCPPQGEQCVAPCADTDNCRIKATRDGV